MQRARHTSAAEYLDRTASAVQHQFEGMKRYLGVLHQVRIPVYVDGEGYGEELDRAFAIWQRENAPAIEAASQATREFMAESFALDTLAGAVLQVADKAFELYGQGTSVPAQLQSEVPGGVAKYFVGRQVRGVPLGAAVYAGRNQHAHFEEAPRKATAAILRVMATHAHPGIVDPALDPVNPGLLSMAHNFVYLLGWEGYEQYERDMRQALGI